MSHAAMIIALSCLVIAGCPRTEPAEPQAPPTEEPRSDASKPGSDRDEHGCIPSAGYRWCERTQQCERPWELAKRENFENTGEEFEAWCSGAADDSSDGN